MSVQLEQFRVAGVDAQTGEDVSVIIEAASKAAAEVKAEKQGIETTLIVRLKQADELPPSESELFSADAAEALSSRRTDSLIEQVAMAVPEERAKPVVPAMPAPKPDPKPPTALLPTEVVAAVTRPAYTSPVMGHDREYSSPFSAFAFVLLVIAGVCGGAYYVLVHEPNALIADEHELIFGEDLYPQSATQIQDAPKPRVSAFVTDKPGARIDEPRYTQQPPADLPRQSAVDVPPLVLQSVVTSHEGRFAVINGKLYKQGAQLAGCTLRAVADDWVLMERLGEQFVLEIESNDAVDSSR